MAFKKTPFHSHRQGGGLEHGPQREGRLHLTHAGQAGQVLAVDAGEILGVFGHDLQQVIRLPRHQVTFQNVGNLRHLALEGVQQFIGLALQGALSNVAAGVMILLFVLSML